MCHRRQLLCTPNSNEPRCVQELCLSRKQKKFTLLKIHLSRASTRYYFDLAVATACFMFILLVIVRLSLSLLPSSMYFFLPKLFFIFFGVVTSVTRRHDVAIVVATLSFLLSPFSTLLWSTVFLALFLYFSPSSRRA